MYHAVYIHIPFCVQKCRYCDFVSFSVGDRLEELETYVTALVAEINLVKVSKGESKPLVKTIFLGGGTPSLLSAEQMKRLTEALEGCFDLSQLTEYTVETNPGTVDAHKLKGYRQCGVNRLSIGVQSLSDDLLNTIGRVHDRAKFLETYQAARAAGFDNISLDLMFGLPGQTLDLVKADLEAVVALGPEHISAYSLKVEEGTPFHRMYEAGQLLLPDEDTERVMHATVTQILSDNGYHHYEVSNYAKEGRASQHNLAYWTMVPYFAFGLAAHGFTGHMRYANHSDLNLYYKAIAEGKLPVDTTEAILHDDLVMESLMVGLRLVDGVDVADLEKRFDFDFEKHYGVRCQKLVEQGLLHCHGPLLAMTNRGMDIQNTVLAELLLD